MEFNLIKATEILERTPTVLENLLIGLSDEWLHSNWIVEILYWNPVKSSSLSFCKFSIH